MSKNLYVGNLAFQVTSDDLRDLFSPFGDVNSAQVVMDRDTGRSRGFGFVEMGSGGDAAIDALNGKDHGGRALTVNEARPREQRSGGGRRKPCPDCGGTGKYVGLDVVELCQACSGLGIA